MITFSPSTGQIIPCDDIFRLSNGEIVYSCSCDWLGLWKRQIYLFGKFWPWFPTWKSPHMIVSNDPKLIEAVERCFANVPFVDEDGKPVG